jgi:Rieske Fe-S protein
MDKPVFSITRRDFLLGVITTTFFCSGCKNGSGSDTHAPEPFLLGNVHEINTGVTVFENLRISIEKRIREESILLRALQLVCTHQACALRTPSSDTFHDTSGVVYVCPCHGARFNGEGEVLQGPATKPLRWIRLSATENGDILMHPDEKVDSDFWLEL